MAKLFGIDIGNIAKSVAGLVPGGNIALKALPIVTNILEGGKADRASKRAAQQSQQLYEEQARRASLLQSQLDPAVSAAIEGLIQQIRAGSDPTARFRAGAERSGASFRDASDALLASYGGRGFDPATSGLSASLTNAALTNAANTNAIARDADLQSDAQYQGLLSNVLNTGMNAGAAVSSSAAQGLGGLGGMWASRAGGYAGGLKDLGGLVDGILGADNSTKATKGLSTVGTNRPAPANPLRQRDTTAGMYTGTTPNFTVSTPTYRRSAAYRSVGSVR